MDKMKSSCLGAQRLELQICLVMTSFQLWLLYLQAAVPQALK